MSRVEQELQSLLWGRALFIALPGVLALILRSQDFWLIQRICSWVLVYEWLFVNFAGSEHGQKLFGAPQLDGLYTECVCLNPYCEDCPTIFSALGMPDFCRYCIGWRNPLFLQKGFDHEKKLLGTVRVIMYDASFHGPARLPLGSWRSCELPMRLHWLVRGAISFYWTKLMIVLARWGSADKVIPIDKTKTAREHFESLAAWLREAGQTIDGLQIWAHCDDQQQISLGPQRLRPSDFAPLRGLFHKTSGSLWMRCCNLVHRQRGDAKNAVKTFVTSVMKETRCEYFVAHAGKIFQCGRQSHTRLFCRDCETGDAFCWDRCEFALSDPHLTVASMFPGVWQGVKPDPIAKAAEEDCDASSADSTTLPLTWVRRLVCVAGASLFSYVYVHRDHGRFPWILWVGFLALLPLRLYCIVAHYKCKKDFWSTHRAALDQGNILELSQLLRDDLLEFVVVALWAFAASTIFLHILADLPFLPGTLARLFSSSPGLALIAVYLVATTFDLTWNDVKPSRNDNAPLEDVRARLVERATRIWPLVFRGDVKPSGPPQAFRFGKCVLGLDPDMTRATYWVVATICYGLRSENERGKYLGHSGFQGEPADLASLNEDLTKLWNQLCSSHDDLKKLALPALEGPHEDRGKLANPQSLFILRGGRNQGWKECLPGHLAMAPAEPPREIGEDCKRGLRFLYDTLLFAAIENGTLADIRSFFPLPWAHHDAITKARRILNCLHPEDTTNPRLHCASLEVLPDSGSFFKLFPILDILRDVAETGRFATAPDPTLLTSFLNEDTRMAAKSARKKTPEYKEEVVAYVGRGRDDSSESSSPRGTSSEEGKAETSPSAAEANASSQEACRILAHFLENAPSSMKGLAAQFFMLAWLEDHARNAICATHAGLSHGGLEGPFDTGAFLEFVTSVYGSVAMQLEMDDGADDLMSLDELDTFFDGEVLSEESQAPSDLLHLGDEEADSRSAIAVLSNTNISPKMDGMERTDDRLSQEEANNMSEDSAWDIAAEEALTPDLALDPLTCHGDDFMEFGESFDSSK